MLSLIYVSSAVAPFSDAELVALLQQSREKNSRLDITGMLLYKEGNFIQVLEGSAEAVEPLFQTIAADPRHRGIIRLVATEIDHRDFPEWTMAFRNLSDPDLRDVPGYSEFMNESLTSDEFRANPIRARRLLEIFRRNLTR